MALANLPFKNALCETLECRPFYMEDYNPDITAYSFNRTHFLDDNLLNYMRLALMSEDMARCAVDNKGVAKSMTMELENEVPDIKSDSCVLTNLRRYNMVSFYNEVATLLEALEFMQSILSAKTPRTEDEKLLEETKRLMAGGNPSDGSESEYTGDQLFNRMNALIAAIDEKLILESKPELIWTQLQNLVAVSIDSDIY